MIDYVCGRVVSKSPSAVVVDVGGIGYLLQVPLSTLGSVKEGENAKLFTSLLLRENEVRLFGFATIEERELFCRLLEVNKVGPAIAMSTLSALGVDEFYRLLQRGESKALAARVKGMGAKTAERVMLELRTISKGFVSTQILPASHVMQIVSDCVKALVSLGSTREQAEKAVETALKELGPNADAEALFRRALAIR